MVSRESSSKRLLPAGFIKPCLPSKVDRPPSGPDWIHEIKYDGFRLLALRRGDDVHLLTRRGTNWTARFPMIANAIAQLDCVSCLIDTEVIAHNEDGIPDFKALRRREPPSLYAFDLLEIDGEDVRRMPIETRKQMLRRLILGRAPALLYSEEIDAPPELAFAHICKLGLEGIVSKRRGTAYESGRSDCWVKTINPSAPAVVRLLEEDWN